MQAMVLPTAVIALSLLATDATVFPIKAFDQYGRVLPGVRFAFAGVESDPTTDSGVTLLTVPGMTAGESIKLDLPRSVSEEWFLIDSTVHLPAGAWEGPAEVALMQRAEFREFAGAARAATAEATRSGSESSGELEWQVLVKLAEQYSLSESDLTSAIASFGDTGDAMDRGIAAFLAGECSEAKSCIALESAGRLAELLAWDVEVAKRRRVVIDFFRQNGIIRNDINASIRLFVQTEIPQRRGIHACEIGQYTEAVTILTAVAAIQENKLVQTLRYLGAAQFSQSELWASLKTFRKAVALHGDDTELLSKLGLMLFRLKKFSASEEVYRRSLAIDESIHGADHPQVGSDLVDLASVLLSSDRPLEAEPLLRRALSILETSLGEEHSSTQRARDNLTMLQETLRREATTPPDKPLLNPDDAPSAPP